MSFGRKQTSREIRNYIDEITTEWRLIIPGSRAKFWVVC